MPLGIEYEGARYHVLSRGDRRTKTLLLTMGIESDSRKPSAKRLREPLACARVLSDGANPR